eukprot:6642392-Alexandrium_andersonii.AAC.1
MCIRDSLAGGHEGTRKDDSNPTLHASPGAFPARGRHRLGEGELARPDPSVNLRPVGFLEGYQGPL